MKFRMVTFAAVLVLASVGLAWAANIDGKWVAQIQGQQGTQEQTFTFKAEGEKLTGSVTTQRGEAPISDGTIKGDEISFTQTFEMQGNSVKIIYKGKISGDEIKFTRAREGGNRPPTEFTAKRVK